MNMEVKDSKMSVDIERITSTILTKNVEHQYLRKRKKTIAYWKRLAMPINERPRTHHRMNYWAKPVDLYLHCILMGNTMWQLSLSVALAAEISAGTFNALLIFITLIVIMPLSYVEIFLGRYTRLTNASLYKMSPIFFGYCILIFLVNTIFMPRLVIDIGKLIAYLIHMFLVPYEGKCVGGSLELGCYDISRQGPINRSDCVIAKYAIKCGKETFRYLSTYIYWDSLQREHFFFKISFAASLAAFLMYIMCNMSMRVVGILLRFAFIFNVGMYTIILLMALCHDNFSRENFWIFFNFNYEKMGLQELTTLVIFMTSRIGLITPSGFMTYAAYDTRPTTSAALDSFVIGLTNMLLTIYLIFIFHTVGFVMADIMQVNVQVLLIRYIEIYLTLIPEFLRIAGMPEFFVMGYVLCVILVHLVKSSILIRMQVMNFFDFLPRAEAYMKQVLFAWFFLLIMLVVLLLFFQHVSFSAARFSWRRTFFFCNMHFLHSFKLLGEVVLFFYCYGVSRLDDDFSFATSRRPLRFWRILWYIYPTTLMISIAFSLHFLIFDGQMKIALLRYSEPDKVPLTLGIFLGLYGLVFLSCTFLHSISMLKKENSLDLLIPNFHWGPPERAQRIKRKLFAPQKLIRSEPQLAKKIRWQPGAVRMLHDMDAAKRLKRAYVFNDAIFFENIQEIQLLLSNRDLVVRHLR